MPQAAIREPTRAASLHEIDAERAAALIATTKECVRASYEALRQSRKLLAETEPRVRS